MRESARRKAQKKSYKERNRKLCECGTIIAQYSTMCRRCAGRLGLKVRWGHS